MLNQLESLTQRVGGSNKLIDQWLHSRKQVLVAYYSLVGIKPNREKHTPLNEKALENFCHNLVDYLSAGHFHIYERIIKDVEGATSPKMALRSQIYPALQDNTQQVMAFHDNCAQQADQDGEHYQRFNQRLSDVGEMLAARFALEDQLIKLAAQAAEASPPTTSSPA